MRSCQRVTCLGTLILSFLFFFLCGWLVIATVVIGSNGAPSSSDKNAISSSSGKLVLPDGEPSTIDPALAMDSLTAQYIAEIFSGLVTLNRDLEVVPDIAESWKISDDGTVYTFYLRPDAKFQDGRKVTATDFKLSMERAARPSTGSLVAETYLGDIVGAKEMLDGKADSMSGIKVLDDHTLQITTTSPKAYFLSKLTYPTAFVVDVNNADSAPNWFTKANGTGPFKIKEWRRGQQLTLIRNNLFYGDAPKLDEVDFLFHAGDPLTLYESGEVDVAGISASDIDLIEDKSSPLSKEAVTAPELSISYVAFNTSQPPFDDAKVRQAFAHAIDKDKLVSVVLKQSVQKAEGILPPGLPGYDQNIQGISYDPDLARQLISESKYRSSIQLPPITITTGPRAGSDARLITALVDMWRKNLGVDVQVQETSGDNFMTDLYRRTYQMYVSGWIADYPDAQNFLQLLFHSKSSENRSSYSNPEVDRLLDQAESERQLASRLMMYQQAEKIIVQDAAWIPLYFGKDYSVVKPYVHDYRPAPVVLPILKDAWLDNSK